MRIHAVTIAYNSGRSIFGLADSILNTDHDVTLEVFTHSTHEETVQACQSLSHHVNVVLHDYRSNRGVARSWNDGMINGFEGGADIVLIFNDDIKFSPGDLDKIAAKATRHPKNYMVSSAGWHEGLKEWRPSQGYSCFALNPISYERIGCFDQNFFPAYVEDQDHHRRADLQGLVEENCSDTNVIHLGSSTISRDEILSLSNMATQARNIKYFRRKWGSDGLGGGFSTPFGSEKFGLYISPEDRHHPYGEYDRKDVPR